MSKSEKKSESEQTEAESFIDDTVAEIINIALKQGSDLYSGIKKLKNTNGNKNVLVEANFEHINWQNEVMAIPFTYSTPLKDEEWKGFKNETLSQYPSIDHDETSLAFILFITVFERVVLYPVTFNKIITEKDNDSKTDMHDLFGCTTCKKMIKGNFIKCNKSEKCLIKYCDEKCRELNISHKCIAPRCNACNKIGKLVKCSACGTARYCDKVCQVSHWTIHKLKCQKLKEVRLSEEDFKSKIQKKEENKTPSSD